MRKWLALSVLATMAACAATEEPAGPTGSSDAGSSDAKAEGAAKDGSSVVDQDSSVESDAAATDAGKDASSDAPSSSDATSDAPADAKQDVALDAPSDAPADVPDSGCPGATPSACVPPSGNVAFCGTAAATSTYGGYPASQINDDVLTTSWYADTGACPSNACPGTSINVVIALDTPRTVKRIELYGNRDNYPSGYDTLTARVQLLDASDVALATEDVTTTRGNEPNGDATITLASAVTCVSKIRVVVLTGEAEEPGIAEVRAFAQ